MNTAIAYAAAIFLFGAAGGIVGAIVSFGAITGVGKPTTWALFSGITGAIFTYWLGVSFFSWMDVHFGWYTYLISMVPVILNDGRRAARDGLEAIGVESSHARGTMLGMMLSLVWHFFR